MRYLIYSIMIIVSSVAQASLTLEIGENTPPIKSVVISTSDNAENFPTIHEINNPPLNTPILLDGFTALQGNILRIYTMTVNDELEFLDDDGRVITSSISQIKLKQTNNVLTAEINNEPWPLKDRLIHYFKVISPISDEAKATLPMDLQTLFN